MSRENVRKSCIGLRKCSIEKIEVRKIMHSGDHINIQLNIVSKCNRRNCSSKNYCYDIAIYIIVLIKLNLNSVYYVH